MNTLIPLCRVDRRRQHGMTLIMTLLMLIIVLLIGLAATQIALQGEKTARNDRDRQIAFQGAEAALLDAEMDIEASPSMEKSRSQLFARNSTVGFPAEGEVACNRGMQNIHLGLCRSAVDGVPAIWQTIDFLDTTPSTTHSVPYGHFTGRVFPAGSGSLPAKVPRYIIELIPDKTSGTRADNINYLYRITAIGFGAHELTQVVLQTIYRKAA